MSDLTERLRQVGSYRELCDVLADEIDRLRVERDGWQAESVRALTERDEIAAERDQYHKDWQLARRRVLELQHAEMERDTLRAELAELQQDYDDMEAEVANCTLAEVSVERDTLREIVREIEATVTTDGMLAPELWGQIYGVPITPEQAERFGPVIDRAMEDPDGK